MFLFYGVYCKYCRQQIKKWYEVKRYYIFAAFFAFVLGEGIRFYSLKYCLPFLFIYLLILCLWGYDFFYAGHNCFGEINKKHVILKTSALFCLSCIMGCLFVERALAPMYEAEKFMHKQICCKACIDSETVALREKGISGVLTPENYKFRLRFYLPFKKNLSQQEKNKYLRQLLFRKVNVCAFMKPLVFTANPGSFNGELYNTVEGIYGKIYISGKKGEYLLPAEKIKSPTRIISAYSLLLKEKIKNIPGCVNGDIISSVLLGGSSGVSKEKRQIIQDCGLAHILSVSGTHVAVLTTFLLFILKKISPLKRFLYIGSFLVIYSIVCGLRAPSCRAVIMLIVCMYGNFMAEKRVLKTFPCNFDGGAGASGEGGVDGGTDGVGGSGGTGAGAPGTQGIRAVGGVDRMALLLITAWLLLLYRPLWLFSLGFRLSFVSVAGLCFLLRKISLQLSRFLSGTKSELMAVTVTAQLVTLPFTVNAFNRISLIAVFSNILLIPVMEVAMVLSFCIIPIICISPWAGAFLLRLPDLLLSICLKGAELLNCFPYAVISTTCWSLVLICCYYIFMFCFLDVGFFSSFSSRTRKIILSVSLGGFILVKLLPYAFTTPFTVRFMDVGQGDAVLISSPEGRHIMVDTGGMQGGMDTGKDIIIPYLRYLGIEKLDALYISHGDYDHIGGASGLVNNFKVNKIYLGQGSFTKNEKDLLLSLPPSTKALRAKQGETHSYGDMKTGILEALDGKNVNDNSIVMLIACNGETFFTGGDASFKVEESAADNLLIENVKLLKAGHHGSSTSTSKEFLQRINPAVTVISCGRYNRHGHPVPAVQKLLKASGTRLMRTDRDGAVRVRMSEGNLCVQSYRKERPQAAYVNFYRYP